MSAKTLLASLLLAVSGMAAQTNYDFSRLKMEKLDRGVVAVRASKDSVMVSWRYLTTDPFDQSFEVYRDGKLVGNTTPQGMSKNCSTSFMDYNPHDAAACTYEVRPAKGRLKGTWTLPTQAPYGYIDIALDPPASDDAQVVYHANDASAADLDGDGQMEIVLKWEPSNAHDNSHSGLTDPTIIDAYKLDGKRLWRIHLGRNIRSGAHYTQFMVYDLDGDGKAEVVMKTADGTVDGKGKVIGDAHADWREGVRDREATDRTSAAHPATRLRAEGKGRTGIIISGPEYLTVFNGQTGAAIETIDYLPPRGELQSWGDNYGNRSDRFLACVAYLDGIHPSVVMCRGYYTRMTLAAYDFDGKHLKKRWFFDSNTEGRDYHGQGNHNLRVGDVDGDGRDEIIYGACAIDDNGKGLYSTRMGHGDAMHLTAFFPNDDKLYVWDCHENKKDGTELHDAATGEIICQFMASSDVGRCMASDIDPTNPGLEMWSSATGGIAAVTGKVIAGGASQLSTNMAVWWDGDLLRELLDHEEIAKYDWQEQVCRRLQTLDGCRFNNGTKSNPCMQGDIVGDWREEVLTRTPDNRHLRLYITTLPTPYRFHTFLQDPVYRLSITTQNVAYNQPTQPGFFFGEDLKRSGRRFRGWQF
ncbi:MAG: rhamnogalacturonan lyase [Bacteroidales bacterium]|nr:rhamnogalacturonan lyase [Candidatus Physcousia equi]